MRAQVPSTGYRRCPGGPLRPPNGGEDRFPRFQVRLAWPTGSRKLEGRRLGLPSCGRRSPHRRAHRHAMRLLIVAALSLLLAAANSGSSGSTPVSFPKVTASGGAAKAVAYAKAQVGKPYAYGADGPDSFDCSGLTMMAWAQAGVSLPHSSSAQYSATRRISAGELQPGDLIFYYSPISHVAIYVGGGMQVAATHTGDYVRLQALHTGITGYGRPGG